MTAALSSGSADLPSKRSTSRLCIAGCIVCVGALMWALWPLEAGGIKREAEAISTRALAAAGQPKNAGRIASAPIDLRAFDAQLWKAPPKPPPIAAAPPAPAPAAPPLRLQLVAIIQEQLQTPGALAPAIRRAALFDPDTNRLHSVSSGDTLLRYRVGTISADSLQLSDTNGSTSHTLRMKSGELRPLVPTRSPTAGAPLKNADPASHTAAQHGGVP